jgi:hypothetical protein
MEKGQKAGEGKDGKLGSRQKRMVFKMEVWEKSMQALLRYRNRSSS